MIWIWEKLKTLRGKKSGLMEVDEFRVLIERERHRADRGDHAFALVVIDLSGAAGDLDAVSRTAGYLHSRLRTVDAVGWYDSTRIGLVLPYTSQAGARDLAARLDMPGEFIPASEYTIYMYPYRGGAWNGPLADERAEGAR